MEIPAWTPVILKTQCNEVLRQFDRQGDTARAAELTVAISKRHSAWESIAIRYTDDGTVICTIPRRHVDFVVSFEVDTPKGLECFAIHVLTVYDRLRAS